MLSIQRNNSSYIERKERGKMTNYRRPYKKTCVKIQWKHRTATKELELEAMATTMGEDDFSEAESTLEMDEAVEDCGRLYQKD